MFESQQRQIFHYPNREKIKNKLLASNLQPHLFADSVPQPIFILGTPCSFTSHFCAMLGRHPGAYAVPELNLFMADTLEEMTNTLTDLRYFQIHGLLRTIAQIYTGEQTIKSINAAHRWILNRLHWTTGDVYHELCRKIAPLYMVDHSRIYSSSSEILGRIHLTFPNAHYLHIVRHPRSQGATLVGMQHGNTLAIANNSVDYSTDPPTLDPQFLWYRVQRTILEFLNSVPASQQMRLLSEDIFQKPDLCWKKICRWLNLIWNEVVFEAILHLESSPYSCFGPFQAQLGDDPDFLRSPALPTASIVNDSNNKLEGSLPWRPDGKGFLPHVIQLAQEFGYE